MVKISSVPSRTPSAVASDAERCNHRSQSYAAAPWTRSGALVDILDFFRRTLGSPEAHRDQGNDGPRMFLARAHLYMSPEEMQKAVQVLRDSPEAAANFSWLLARQEVALTAARQLSDAFDAKRKSFR
jgi:hypothetical protein